MILVIKEEPVPLAVDQHGVVRVGGTRLTLDSVLYSYKAGDSPEEISQNFLGLSLADVYAILTYYHRHKAEVEQYLEEEQRAAEAVLRELEAAHPADGLRARLREQKARRTGS